MSTASERIHRRRGRVLARRRGRTRARAASSRSRSAAAGWVTSTATTRRSSASPKSVWQELYDEQRMAIARCSPAGPVGARRIEGDADIRDVIALLRVNYVRVVARRAWPAEAA